MSQHRVREGSGRPRPEASVSVGPARRVTRVQEPVIPLVGGWVTETPGTISLGQGMVGYGPPPEVLERLPRLLAGPEAHRYHADAGLPELRAAFAAKLRQENRIDADPDRRIMVTAGANQGFLQVVLSVCDVGDEVILPRPYYFNHEMAVRLAGCQPIIVDTDEGDLPHAETIAAAMTPRTRAVVTCSPNNPTGAVYPPTLLTEINRLCGERGVYHISDEAYEYFTFDGAVHLSPGSLGGDDHTISLFSLSKAYGFAGWRIGFVVVPERLFPDLLKVQDTNVICPPVASQLVARELLACGRSYCHEHLPAIGARREQVMAALGAIPGLVEVPRARGAFYVLARVHTPLPARAVAERLVREHRVAVIPGETFGVDPGDCRLRISYGALDGDSAATGLDRLTTGLRAICA